MQLLEIDKKTARQLFTWAVVGVSVFSALTTQQKNPFLFVGAVLLVVCGMAPLYMWVAGNRHGLPIWPAFAAYTSYLFAMPVLQASRAIEHYAESAVAVGMLTAGAFFVIGTFCWSAITSRETRPPDTVVMLEPGSAVRSLLWCIAAGALFNANTACAWVQFPGNTMQVFRGVTGGLSFLGIFALAYFHGARLLKPGTVIAYLCLTFLTIVFSLTGLLLTNAIPPLSLAVIGYTLGAGRPPWVAIAAIVAVLAFLHPGKYVMRELRADNPALRNGVVGIKGLASFYAEWFSYGAEALGNDFGSLVGASKVPGAEGAAPSFLERAGNLHMLLLVQQKSPGEVPFLNGMTYAPIPRLLIPRFLTPDKSISHVGNIMLSINYGLQDEEGARNTSIGWSPIAEAYANFGYLGIVALALLLSSLYAMVTRLTSRVPITSFRFVAGLVVLAGVTNDNSLGVFITMQFQGVVGVALASFFLMQRRSNPYADDFWLVSSGSPSRGVAGATESGSVLPSRVAKRAPAWVPVSRRAAYVAASARETSSADGGLAKPRQPGVPFRNYRGTRT